MSRGAGAPFFGDATGEDLRAADAMRLELRAVVGGGGMSRGAGAPFFGDATGEDLRAADALSEAAV